MTKPQAKVHTHSHHHAASHGAARRLKISIILFAAVSITCRLCPIGYWPELALYAGVYLFVGYEIVWNAIRGILSGSWFDENFLMTVATLGVFALELYEREDDFGEAIAVILFFRLGEYFQGYAARRSLRQAERHGLQLNSESRSEAFITRFARVYTPIVCLGALALAVGAPMINICVGAAPQWPAWLYRALTFLVISCPCALVISIPLTFYAAITGAGRRGIFITDGCCLETLHRGTFPEGDIVFAAGADRTPLARRIASRCMHIVWQNIGLAIGVKVVCLACSAVGYAPMWLAIFADTGIMVICVLNALRAARA